MRFALRLSILLGLAAVAWLVFERTLGIPAEPESVVRAECLPVGEAGFRSGLSGLLVDLGVSGGEPLNCRAREGWTTPSGDLVAEEVEFGSRSNGFVVRAGRALIRSDRPAGRVHVDIEAGVEVQLSAVSGEWWTVRSESTRIVAEGDSVHLVFPGLVTMEGDESAEDPVGFEATAAGADFSIRARTVVGDLEPPVRVARRGHGASVGWALETSRPVRFEDFRDLGWDLSVEGPAGGRVDGHAVRFPNGLRLACLEGGPLTAEGKGLAWRVPVAPGVLVDVDCRGPFRLSPESVRLEDHCRIRSRWGSLDSNRMDWSRVGPDVRSVQ